ncbi:P-loop containing nucleoside triphosphate hydrolase protein [Aspergillus sclerotiicarbonarius CBS 121057]|uniref:P-loop containing nucleoside triphosphate hydrolase protein n=1 Tax=Aspergillus sclerotiicarbonarius (strain CBS 121057 / IBT 28362) TaxID=1448318 RepID=A0A319DWZ8_ASPSB|nr:P-loop containing nucleoside triphosphate hydrolase protein [Aspergillus sclerotiicarbonarius CBS 121057]
MLQVAIFAIGAGMIVASASYLVVVALIAIQRFYVQTSRQLRTLRLEQQAPLYTHFQETIAGLVSIRAFGWAAPFRARNATLLDDSQRPMYLLKTVQAWLGLVLNLLVAGLGTVLIGTIVSLRDTVHPALVGLGLLNIMSFNENLSELIVVWSLTETSLSALARVRSFVQTTDSEEKPGETGSPPTAWPSHGAVTLDQFSAAYSASGLSRAELRQRFNIITQEPYWVTSETVRFNLDPWGATSQDDDILIRVLETCQLWSVIEARGGLNAILEADFLSHGQRQLFCLARALLRRSKVVVLDEVSSSVDIETDRRMQEIIRKEFEGCTIIAVAHRLETIVDFDRVVVLSDGRVVESGPPPELLARDGWFKRLYES